jgi:ATP-dependent helicase/DNAse subunit B
VILCGLVDWVEYMDKDDSLRVIDFKTGKHDEKEDSFQLPIYKILVESLQKRKVKSGAYWYLRKDKFPTEIELVDEDVEEIKSQILKIGIDIKQRKQDNKFECKYKTETGESCFDCRDFEMIKNFDEGNVVPQVEYLGVGEYKQDLYLMKK